MAETIFQTLDRMGVSLDQFCALAAISRDDLDALNSGAAVPKPRISALLRMITNTGRAKIAPIMAMLVEERAREWRQISSFPAYEVSDDGMVRRCSASRKGSLRTLKPMLDPNGYYKVTLYRNGKPEPQRIHRLVCEAFHGPAPEGRPYACHRDSASTHNEADNLYWGSAAENSADWQHIRRERIRNAVHRKYTPAWRRQQRALKSMDNR